MGLGIPLYYDANIVVKDQYLHATDSIPVHLQFCKRFREHLHKKCFKWLFKVALVKSHLKPFLDYNVLFSPAIQLDPAVQQKGEETCFYTSPSSTCEPPYCKCPINSSS
ncbi:hypothetical protein ILYODFUR_003827 [Ilyodon furcidens]|uniref:Uncharacterized protein n=1 Tax=Ilyodon furcidens TaxID=33524 RepID=A0ABV0TS39_9TELE